MKLFTPQESKDSKEKETALNIMRTQEVRKVLGESQKQLQKIEATFDITLANQRKQFIDMQKQEMDKLQTIQREVATLEDKRLQLLLPIEPEREKIEDILRKAQIILNNAETKEEDMNEMEALLEERLDNISEQEQKVIDTERKIRSKLQGIEYQEEMTKIGAKKLSDEIAKFTAESKAKDKELIERKIELDKYNYSVTAKVNSVVLKEADLEIREKQLADKRETFTRAWNELKAKEKKWQMLNTTKTMSLQS